MSDEHLDAGGYLDWELDNHLRAYGATPAMYETFFESVVTTLAEVWAMTGASVGAKPGETAWLASWNT